jgi:hypothetical protein
VSNPEGFSRRLRGGETPRENNTGGRSQRRAAAVTAWDGMNDGLQLPNAQWMQQIAAAGWWSQGPEGQGIAQGVVHRDAVTPASATEQRRGVKRKGPANATAHGVEHQWAYKYRPDPVTPRTAPPQQMYAGIGGTTPTFHPAAVAPFAQHATVAWAPATAATTSSGQAQGMPPAQEAPCTNPVTLKTSAGPPIFSRGVGLIFASGADQGASDAPHARHFGLSRQQSVP